MEGEIKKYTYKNLYNLNDFTAKNTELAQSLYFVMPEISLTC